MSLPAPDSTVAVRRDVPFRDTDERRLHLDWYRVDDPADDTPRPAVLLVHGGAWHEGSTGQFARYGLDLARAGFVAVDVSYRLSGEATFPAPAADVAAALAWVRSHAADLGVDPDRVAVFGHSAGAHLALLTALAPGAWSDEPVDPPAAAVGASGPYEFRGVESPDVRALLGDTEDDQPDRYREASPVVHVHGNAPPTLLVHGEDDEVVPVESSRLLTEALSGAGTAVELNVTGDADHVYLHSSAHYPAVRDRVTAFLREQL